MCTSVVVFTYVAVVVVAVPDVNAERLSLVMVERTQTFVPSALDSRLLRLVAATLNVRAQRKTFNIKSKSGLLNLCGS